MAVIEKDAGAVEVPGNYWGIAVGCNPDHPDGQTRAYLRLYSIVPMSSYYFHTEPGDATAFALSLLGDKSGAGPLADYIEERGLWAGDTMRGHLLKTLRGLQ